MPIALSFFMSGRWGAGIFLSVMAVVIGVLDNILRPLLVGQGLGTHPIWLLLSILGGLAVFGGMGLIYGPMVLVLLGTIIRIFVREEREENQVVLTPVVAAPAQPPAS